MGGHLDHATGLPSSAVPYAARHTFATIMGNVERIKDRALKRYIGHKPASPRACRQALQGHQAR
jgi:hypothetical protein